MMIYSYLRRSKEEQSATSIENQRRKIFNYCEGADIFVDKEFVDFCSGGLKLEQREQGLILSKLLRKGDTIVVANLDRYSRNHFGLISDVEKYKRMKVKLVFTDLGDVVSADSLGSIFYQILSIMSEWYRKSLSEKQLLAKDNLRKQGKYLGGRVTKGFDIGEDNKLVECEKEQKEIRLVLMHRNSGLTFKQICEEMQSYTGRKWHPSFVHKLVHREQLKVA